ncbi:HAD-like domain [Phytophthora cactorum]|nr:HAD-like domain [Phytophthora cactorum]
MAPRTPAPLPFSTGAQDRDARDAGASQKLRESITIGVVGGSDLVKQKEQLGEDVINNFDYSFSENGLVASTPESSWNLKSQYTNPQINKLVSFCLRYIADLDIPVKRGTFVEFRMGMINVSPIGRNCSQEERDEFEKYDHIRKIRETFFPEYNLTYSIGGQISFDVFPSGWDKTFCLRYLDAKDYDEIHFFGDKTHKGGNDYEIYTSERTIGHSILDQLFP